MPKIVTVPRTLTSQREVIQEIELHTFGDASAKGVCATVYAIVKQSAGINVGLVAARARFAKQDLTIPRLELISALMATNLDTNVRQALGEMPVKRSFGWLAGQYSGPSVAKGWRRIQAIRGESCEKNPSPSRHHLAPCRKPGQPSRFGK